MTQRVLLVEDEPATREHLAEAVRTHPELVLVAAEASVAAGRHVLESAHPDVLLTDLGLPDGSGVELIRAASLTGHTLPLVITVFGDEEHVVEAIRAGALGYLLKSDGQSEITAALLDMVAGGSPISPSIARYLLRAVRTASPDLSPDAPRLSEREYQVLGHIVKGFTYEEIAGLLDLSPATVATHVRKVYRKLSVHSRSEATYEALQLGLIRPDE